MLFCFTYFHLKYFAYFKGEGGGKQTNRYLSVAFSGLKIDTNVIMSENVSRNIFNDNESLIFSID